MFFILADSDSSETFNDPTSSIQALEGRVPNYLLLVSLLEQLCSLYEGDSEKSKKIFTGRSSNWCSLAHFDQYWEISVKTIFLYVTLPGVSLLILFNLPNDSRKGIFT